MRKIHIIMLAVFLALSLSACLTSRVAVNVQDHQKLPITTIETLDTKVYYMLITAAVIQTHQFWLCNETDVSLVCSRACGGRNDVECPTFQTTSTGQGSQTTTNVR